MTVNEQIRDAIIRNTVDIQKYGNGVVNAIMAILNAADQDLVTQLQKRLEKGKFNWTTARLTAVLNSLRGIVTGSYDDALARLAEEMPALAAHEAQMSVGVLKNQLPPEVDLNIVMPPAVQLAAIASTTPIAVGPEASLLLEEIFENLANGKVNRIRQAIRMGMVEGQTIAQMVQRLVGTKANKYRDGILEMDRRGATAIVRTVVNHTSNQAAQMTYSANTDLIKGLRYVATLDTRTSPQCRALDGKVFPVDSGPRPPRHVNCRSFMVPVLKSWRELGIDADEIPEGTRASMDGQVPAEMTYSKWLKGIPDAEQSEILGATRAMLFRSGKLTLDDFISNTGSILTLQQIRAKYPTIWASI